MTRKRSAEGRIEDRKTLGRRRNDAMFPAAPPRAEVPGDYAETLRDLKQRIQQERLRTVLAANSAMVLLYWDIGRTILERQDREGWGARVIDRLSADLREAFSDMHGLSPRNLKYMRAFAAAWPDRIIVQRVVAQIPWRQGKAITNFPAVLPPADSDMAAQVFKDPYLFDFLGTADPRREREVEQALVDHIQRFLLELGAGFAFMGRQVHLEVGSHDYYLDLLFYHVKLRCYVVVELKAIPFDPAFVGQMNLYLSAVDDLLRHSDDQPTIGLLLCKEKDKLTVEYALRDLRKPIGVAEWRTRLVESLPKRLQGQMPTVEQIEKELSGAGASKP